MRRCRTFILQIFSPPLSPLKLPSQTPKGEVRRVRLELTMFLLWLIYSQLRSPLRYLRKIFHSLCAWYKERRTETAGFEPATRWLTASCSTNWAMLPKKKPPIGIPTDGEYKENVRKYKKSKKFYTQTYFHHLEHTLNLSMKN